MKPLAIALAATTFTTAAVVGLAGPAFADVETRGTCSASSGWEADIEREFRVYGIDFEVKTQNANERWRLTVKQNGKQVYSNTRVTTLDFNDRYADVDWEVVRPDRAGVSDRFVLTAKNLTTGETCTTTLRG